MELMGLEAIDVVFCLEALEETLEFGKPRIFNSDQGYNLLPGVYRASEDHVMILGVKE